MSSQEQTKEAEGLNCAWCGRDRRDLPTEDCRTQHDEQKEESEPIVIPHKDKRLRFLGSALETIANHVNRWSVNSSCGKLE